METFIKKFLITKNISSIEFSNFIKKYCKANNKSEPTNEQLSVILQLFQMGIFDLQYVIDRAIELSKIKITILYDKNGNILKYIF
jgi:hypothetical protein